LVKNSPISDESENLLNDCVNEKNDNIFMIDTMKASDASFHYGFTFYKAPANTSKKRREVMRVIYYANGAKVTVPENDAQETNGQRWLDGICSGKHAASSHNLIV
jgi:hypothetical protein